MTTAGRVLDVLAAAGVRTAFGLPGVHNLAFWDALGPDRPRIMGVRHEQTAAYAADGLARATGGSGSPSRRRAQEPPTRSRPSVRPRHRAQRCW